jgi:hypothetical protein
MQEWEAVAPGENLKRLRGDVSEAIARRNPTDQESKKVINWFIYRVSEGLIEV